jgi:hypothetical protein
MYHWSNKLWIVLKLLMEKMYRINYNSHNICNRKHTNKFIREYVSYVLKGVKNNMYRWHSNKHIDSRINMEIRYKDYVESIITIWYR